MGEGENCIKNGVKFFQTQICTVGNKLKGGGGGHSLVIFCMRRINYYEQIGAIMKYSLHSDVDQDQDSDSFGPVERVPEVYN